MEKARPIKRLGVASRWFERGVVGTLDGRTKSGRFARKLERELLSQLGPEPTVSERILVARAVRAQLQLSVIDAQIDAGEEIAPHTSARYGALNNGLRLALVALGLKARAPKAKTPSLQEIANRYAGGAA